MTEELIKVPDLGGTGEVIEITVQVGDIIESETTLAILESDKATMEIPSPQSGTISEILIQVGQKLNQGDSLVKLTVASNPSTQETTTQTTLTEPLATPTQSEITPPQKTSTHTSAPESIVVPDIGATQAVVLEVLIQVGDQINIDTPLLVLESDKASMELPSPTAGQISSLQVKVGDSIKPGDSLCQVIVTSSNTDLSESTTPNNPSPIQSKPQSPVIEPSTRVDKPISNTAITTGLVHAGPAVRRLAREFGINLTQVQGSGPHQRILKEDVQTFVKNTLQQKSMAPTVSTQPLIDFSQWGDINSQPLTRIQQIAAKHFQNSWSTVPHVTQFDLADITELENFRKAHKEKALARDIRLTPLPFLLKACSYALAEMPQFCASLNPEINQIIYKNYIHIGVAVDTPHGLLVPVIRDVDKKGLYELATECIELANKAKNKQLRPESMQGGCFTISSLGSVGGTAFTPLINTPELAILGVSKATHQPQWDGEAFQPRLMLPLSLSYDHRAINGVDAARFTGLLQELLSDIRRLLL